MNENIKKLILDKIEEYETIIVSRHIRPDGDAIGSTKGLVKILRDTYPDKKIYLYNEDYSDYLAFLGGEDVIDGKNFDGALQIVLDTGTEDRISNSFYKKAKELIKIDHHIDDKPYGDISWVEDFRGKLYLLRNGDGQRKIPLRGCDGRHYAACRRTFRLRSQHGKTVRKPLRRRIRNAET